MSHEQKLRMARKMRNRDEEEMGVSVFDSLEWNRRKERRESKALRQYQLGKKQQRPSRQAAPEKKSVLSRIKQAIA